jgi:endonuclease/exonuclease/phosphatase family metal-dependent hydrolase
VAALARELRLGGLYAPAETRWYCRQFGNGVLSRLPVCSWQRIPLPCPHDRSRRNAVLLVLDAPGRSIRVLVTHLTQRDPRDREVQLRAVIELFLALDEPAVLLGDLNSTPDDPAIRRLLVQPGVDDPIGRLVPQASKGRVDWILLRGLTGIAAGSNDGSLSDHPLYSVDVALPVSDGTEPTPTGGPPTSGRHKVE